MEKEHGPATGEKELKSAKEFWAELMELADDDDFNQIEYLLIHRGDFGLSEAKLPGEDEIYEWLEDRAANLGRKLQVTKNEKGIIVPISNGRTK